MLSECIYWYRRYGEELYKEYLEKENQQLKEDLKTLWVALWNNDTEMTSKQSETFDKYYDEFHKKESDVKWNLQMSKLIM